MDDGQRENVRLYNFSKKKKKKERKKNFHELGDGKYIFDMTPKAKCIEGKILCTYIFKMLCYCNEKSNHSLRKYF